MSADSAHQVVQKKLAKTKVVTDFADFKQLVEDAGLKTRVLDDEDFYHFEDGMSQSKLRQLGQEGLRPVLKDFRIVEVRRGSQLLYTKRDYRDGYWRAYA